MSAAHPSSSSESSMTTTTSSFSLLDPALARPAIVSAFKKLSPRVQWRNPVMFVVYIGSILTTGLGIHALASDGSESPAFIFGVSAWLWFTVIFANFAPLAVRPRAHGRGTA